MVSRIMVFQKNSFYVILDNLNTVAYGSKKIDFVSKLGSPGVDIDFVTIPAHLRSKKPMKLIKVVDSDVKSEQISGHNNSNLTKVILHYYFF